MKKPKDGRPTKLTPEVQGVIVDALRAGGIVQVACELAGITSATFFGWIRLSRKESEGPHKEFADAVRRALAEAETRLVGLIGQASTTNWTAAAWLLERRFPKRWGRSKLLPPSDHSAQPQATAAPPITRVRRSPKGD